MTTHIEILNDRVFPVDSDTLYGAFADPEKLAAWWGPEGFSNHISAFDLTNDGTWLVTMTSDNGAEFHNRWTFEEVLAFQRIKMTHHEPVHVFTLEMTFSGEAHGSRLSWRMLFDRTDENELMQKFLHAANEQNFDRLARLLENSGSNAIS